MNFDLSLRVYANHPNAINRCDFVRAHGLKTNRHVLLVLNEIRRQLVFHIEEFPGSASGRTAFDCLLTDALSINENLECAFTALFTVIGDYYSGRMCCINRQIEREPFLSASRRSAEK